MNRLLLSDQPKSGRFRRFLAPARASVSMLKQKHAVVVAKEDELYKAITEEYGAPVSLGRWMARLSTSYHS